MSAQNPTSIVEWLKGLPIPWLVSNPVGSADVTSYGTVLDGQVALTKLAIKAKFPDYAPDDALATIGHERGLVQGGTVAGPSESNDDFRVRLKEAWDMWPYAGTPLAILLQLYYSLGYEHVAIVQQNGLIYTLTTPPSDPPLTDYLNISEAALLESPATPSPVPLYTKTIPAGNPWWRFDDKTDFCSRFALIFYPPPDSWNDIQNPPTPTSRPSISEVNLIRQIVQQWRNAEATCVGIYVYLTGLMWGYPPTQVWGAGTGNWSGTATVFDMEI